MIASDGEPVTGPTSLDPARTSPTVDLQPTHRSLVTVTAAAGWGKSRAIDAATRPHPRRWLEPSPGSDDQGELVQQLRAALTTTELTYVVLRGAHHLLGTEAATLLQQLVDTHLADERANPQLVVISRRDPGLVDDRRRARGDVLEIDARHLAIDVDQARALVAAELEPDRALATHLVDVTGGWPALIRLLIDELRPCPAAERTVQLAAALGPHGPVARYLEAEVLPALDDDERVLLVRAALLGAARSEHLARAADDRGRIEALQRSGLLSGVAGNADRVRVAPALRTVVATALAPDVDPDGRMASELAEALLADGDVAGALELLVAGGQDRQVADVLTSQGDALLRGGHLHAIDRAIRSLPEPSPALVRLHAQALAFLGDWVAALDVLDAAQLPAQGPVPVELALQVGLIHHLRGDLEEALDWYGRADGATTDGPWAALHAWRATAHWLRGELDASREAAATAMQGATTTRDDVASALAHTAAALLAASAGDRHANEAHYRQALHAAERAGDRLLEARIRTNWGSHHLEEGDYLDALEQTDQALELAHRSGFTMIAGIAHCNRAEIMLKTGELDQAVADADEARRILAQVGARTEAYAHHLLGAARTERGELALARQAFERSRRLAAPAGDRQALVPAEVGLATVLAASDPDAAMAAAERARELDGGMLAAETFLVSAWIALARGDRASADDHATEARRLAAERENRAAIAEATTCLALLAADPVPGLREAQALWEELDAPVWATRVELAVAVRSDDPKERAQIGWLERRLAGWGCPTDRGSVAHRLLVTVDTPTRTVVRALGAFVAERDGRTLTPAQWGSRKAQDLVKILVVRGERGIPREELADLLWPGQAYDEVSNRLSVALSLARTALAGETDARPIETQGVVVRLDREAVDVDVELFDTLAAGALRAAQADADDAIEQLLRAEELYGGDLLESDPDADWALDRRIGLRTTYLEVARTVARLARYDDPDLAIRMLLRLLDRDGYDEPAHLNLCVALLRAGRHGEARQRFRLYESRMRELDLPVVPFHELTRAAEQAQRAAS